MNLLMSQDDFARALQAAGQRAGRPNDANKRLVQRWESGAITTPRPTYACALEAVTGLPIGVLGFVPAAHASVADDGHGGHDTTSLTGEVSAVAGAQAAQMRPRGDYSGVWLSRYEYFSSGRNATFSGAHYVTLLQHGDRLTVRSLPGSADSSLTMDLTLDGNVLTGTWAEQTDPNSYYRGARYHGSIQMLAEPTGRRMIGKWVGFGKNMDINTGPWELVFQDASTNKATLQRYNRPPDSEA
jgi:hypothetical protein